MLDFGLAKGADTSTEADPSQSPTSGPEMLTGRPAFDGEDISLLLSSVLQREPEWARVPDGLSPAARVFLERCLVKDEASRVQDIGDVRLALAGAFDSMGTGEALQASSASWSSCVWMLAGGLPREAVRPDPVVRSVIPPGGDERLFRDFAQPTFAISPDGQTVVYRGVSSDRELTLYSRRLDGASSEPIAGAESAVAPVFSPDGTTLVFLSTETGRTQLRSVSTFGGIAGGLSHWDSGRRGLGREPDGGGAGGLVLVSTPGGEAEPLTTLDAAQPDESHRWPSVAPDTRTVFFVATTDDMDGRNELATVDLDTRAVTRLGLAGTAPRYLPTGHLAFVTPGDGLVTESFDLDTLTVTGRPVTLVEGIGTTATGAADWAVSETGTLVFLGGEPGGQEFGRSLAWVSSEGGVAEIDTGREAGVAWPRVSPSGERIAYVANGEVWVRQLDTGLEDLIAGEGFNAVPLWGVTDDNLYYTSTRDGALGIHVAPANASRAGEVRIEEQVAVIAGSWSPDGETLFLNVGGDGQRDLLSLMIGERPVALLQTADNEACPSLSADGRLLAYALDRSGEWRVYVAPADDVSRGRPVSSDESSEPRWSMDGRQLYYRMSSRMMVAGVLSAEPAVGVGRELFTGDFALDPSGVCIPNYDVTPDSRFLMVPGVSGLLDEGPDVVNLVQNWFAEFERLAPIN